MSEVNGLPVAFFVIAGGIIAVLMAWLLMRFGKAIARAVLVGAVVIIGGVLAVAAVGQSAANFQQSRATVEVAQAAQTASISNLLLVGAVGCFGGIALMAVIGALAFAGVVWWKAQQVERQVQSVALPKQRQRPRQALPPEVIYVDDGGFEDLVAIGDLDGMAWEDWV